MRLCNGPDCHRLVFGRKTSCSETCRARASREPYGEFAPKPVDGFPWSALGERHAVVVRRSRERYGHGRAA